MSLKVEKIAPIYKSKGTKDKAPNYKDPRDERNEFEKRLKATLSKNDLSTEKKKKTSDDFELEI